MPHQDSLEHVRHSLVSATALETEYVFKLKHPIGQAKIEHVPNSDVTFPQKDKMIIRVQILKQRIP